MMIPIAIFTCIALVCFYSAHLLDGATKAEVSVEKFPIVYPVEPMFPNYQSIIEDIESCRSANDLNKVYVRIIIFQGCYKDCGKWYEELVTAYLIKEGQLIKSIK